MNEMINITPLNIRVKEYKTKFLKKPKSHMLFMSILEDLAQEPGIAFEKDTSVFQAVFLKLRKSHIKAGCDKGLCK